MVWYSRGLNGKEYVSVLCDEGMSVVLLAFPCPVLTKISKWDTFFPLMVGSCVLSWVARCFLPPSSSICCSGFGAKDLFTSMYVVDELSLSLPLGTVVDRRSLFLPVRLLGWMTVNAQCLLYRCRASTFCVFRRAACSLRKFMELLSILFSCCCRAPYASWERCRCRLRWSLRA